MKGDEGAGRAGAREVWAGSGRARQPLIEGAETFGLRCRRGSARAPTWPGRRSGNDGLCVPIRDQSAMSSDGAAAAGARRAAGMKRLLRSSWARLISGSSWYC